MKAPTEKHLEEWLINNMGFFGTHPLYAADGEIYNGAPYLSVIDSQHHLPGGIADIIANDGSAIHIIELKKHAIDECAIVQTLRYIADVREIVRDIVIDYWMEENVYYERIDRYHFGDLPFEELLVQGHIVGHSIKNKNIEIAARSMYLSLYLYEFDGLEYYEKNNPWAETLRKENFSINRQQQINTLKASEIGAIAVKGLREILQHKKPSPPFDIISAAEDHLTSTGTTL